MQPLPSSQEAFTPNLPLEETPKTNDKPSSIPSSLTVIPDGLNVNNINAPNKRSATDLFGDIGDIDFDEIQLPSKKQKTEEENDLDLIDKILEGRRLRQILAEPMNKLHANCRLNYIRKDNISLDIPRYVISAFRLMFLLLQ